MLIFGMCYLKVAYIKTKKVIAINTYNICKQTDLPRDVILGDSIVEIVGKNEISIENYLCIKEICPEKIVIKCKYYYIFIKGKDMFIDYYNNKICMKISGDINEISFNRSMH